jgi:hypothetical protein
MVCPPIRSSRSGRRSICDDRRRFGAALDAGHRATHRNGFPSFVRTEIVKTEKEDTELSRGLERFSLALRTREALSRRTPPYPPFVRGGEWRRTGRFPSPPYEGGVRGGVFAGPQNVRKPTVKRSRAMTKAEEFQHRLAALEEAVAEMQRRLAKMPDPDNWLDRVIGSVTDVEAFEEALKYGREFRYSDRPSDEDDEKP